MYSKKGEELQGEPYMSHCTVGGGGQSSGDRGGGRIGLFVCQIHQSACLEGVRSSGGRATWEGKEKLDENIGSGCEKGKLEKEMGR
jgi:hypothetical protein